MSVHGETDRYVTDKYEVHEMSWNQIEETLKEFINTAKDQWVWFIDDQIDVLQGKRNHFYGNMHKAYVIDNEEAEKRLAHWQRTQWDKARAQGGQLQNSAYPVTNVTGFSYDKDPANRNWQFRSE